MNKDDEDLRQRLNHFFVNYSTFQIRVAKGVVDDMILKAVEPKQFYDHALTNKDLRRGLRLGFLIEKQILLYKQDLPVLRTVIGYTGYLNAQRGYKGWIEYLLFKFGLLDGRENARTKSAD